MILLQKWVNLVKIGNFLKIPRFLGFWDFPRGQKKIPMGSSNSLHLGKIPRSGHTAPSSKFPSSPPFLLRQRLKGPGRKLEREECVQTLAVDGQLTLSEMEPL